MLSVTALPACDRRSRAGILGTVTSALIAEALAPLRADPEQRRDPARHRRHAVADRGARRRRARSRDHAPAADRRRQRATAWWPASAGGAPPRRGPWSRSGRSRISARTESSCCGPAGPRRCSTRASRSGSDGSTSSAARPTPPTSASSASGSRTRARSSPSTGAGARDEDAARAAIDAIAERAEAAGLRTHWGRKVLEVRPPIKIDKGAGIKQLAGRRRRGDRLGAVRGRRRHRSRRLPRPDRARAGGAPDQRGPGRGDLGGGPVGDPRRGRHRGRWARGVRELLALLTAE